MPKLKIVFKALPILFLGAIGGILGQIFVLPYLAGQPCLQNFSFIKKLNEREVVINPKEEITIQENTALKNAVEKVEKTVVGIKTETKKGEILEGSGLIITSDGLVATLAELVPRGSVFNFFVDGKQVSFEILERDLKQNLALIKIEKENLSTAGFTDLERIKLGERVFLVGVIFKETSPQKVVNQGIIKYFDEDLIQTNIFEKSILKGSPLFDIEGRVLGINTIDSEGKVATIPISKIKSFTGF